MSTYCGEVGTDMENISVEWEKKKTVLVSVMNDMTRRNIAVAFSGGADSALLLKLAADSAKLHGTNVCAITVHTKLHPHHEMEEAKQLAKQIGAMHVCISVDEFGDEQIARNPVNRCYLCKKMIFRSVLEKSAQLGFDTVIDGTNEDDLHVYRPGIQALKELGIRSPLAEAGITKNMVRQWLAELGLAVAGKPATPCLATRIPYGEALDERILSRVAQGEKYLRAMGFLNVRLRVHGKIARIEIDIEQMELLIQNRKTVIEHLKELGFVYITLDLEGFRSGSMDVGILSGKND